MMRLYLKVLGAVALLVSASSAEAAVDPTGDFLASYSGPTTGDVDLTSGNVLFDGTNFAFSVSTNGTVGTTPNSLYVWAVNRGAGIARPTLSPPDGAGLIWDAVVVMFPDNTLRIVTFPAAGAPSILNIGGGTSVTGNSLYALVAGSALQSTGFAPADYSFSLWSRVRVTPGADGVNSEVADLLSGSPLRAAVPEPATWLMMLIGFAGVGLAVRRRADPFRSSTRLGI